MIGEKNLEIILKEESNPIFRKKHQTRKVEEIVKCDLSNRQAPKFYCDGRVIGNERYIKIESK